MLVGVLLGKLVPGLTDILRSVEFGHGSHINAPIAMLIWLMIIPMMMKVDFTSIRNVGKRPRGVPRFKDSAGAFAHPTDLHS